MAGGTAITERLVLIAPDNRPSFRAEALREEGHSVDEAADFFRDLCTRRELEEMSHRWAVVRLLDEGLSYREIAERTGASTATITRINQWLQHGTGGYRRMLERIAR